MQRCSGFSNRSTAQALRRAVALLAMLCLALQASYAQARTESEIKALFFVTLARYTEWPENTFSQPNSPIVIGIIGQDPFGKFLDSLTKNEAVRGRPLVVQRYSSPEEISECHLLYFGAMDVVRREFLLSRIAARPILTVSDTPSFTRNGGAVELFLNEENKIRLRVSRDALARAKLSLSPSIMRLVAYFEWAAQPEYSIRLGKQAIRSADLARGG